MQNVSRAMLLVAMALMATMDIWLATVRCASSPPIDWSRLALGLMTVQVGVLAASWQSRVFSDILISRPPGGSWAALLVAGGFTFVLVRQPLLLSDTTYHKGFASGSYMCPGVPGSWNRGG